MLFIRCFTLFCVVILAIGCATAELSRRAVEKPAEKDYRYINLNVALADPADTLHLTDRIITELQKRDLQTTLAQQTHGVSLQHESDTALLKVDEVDRHIETVEHHRTYGRKSLTQMRGRKESDVPVITLRATLIDTQSGQTVFQADYITQGPWYADSKTVVAALADTLVAQLENEGILVVNKQD